MTAEIEHLQHEMEAAAKALDFEQARRLRDQLNLLRGGATAAEAASADTSGLTRQQPGAMGLGTSQPRPTPPPGWRPPQKPDPMTRATGRRRAQAKDSE
ncbi:MAG: UvrB/UvrC motif-containing protein [Sphingomonas bacterium]